TVGNPTQDGLSFFIRNRGRLIRRTTDKTHYPRGILDQVPSPFVHLHLNKHVSRKELALTLTLLPIPHLDHFFGRDQNFTEIIFHAGELYTLNKRAHDVLLVTRVSMHNVPTLSHEKSLTYDHGN